MGFRDSSSTLPRMKSTASAGVSVTARIDAKPIEYVLVNASGLKRRPSVASSVKTGKNEIVMTSSEKKIEGPTSCIAWMMTSVRGSGWPAWSHSPSFLWMFSMMMIDASTIAPIATAIPPSDMMFAVRCW
jgi:hypothetical protein